MPARIAIVQVNVASISASEQPAFLAPARRRSVHGSQLPVSTTASPISAFVFPSSASLSRLPA
jgi:hypothetical protein